MTKIANYGTWITGTISSDVKMKLEECVDRNCDFQSEMPAV